MAKPPTNRQSRTKALAAAAVTAPAAPAPAAPPPAEPAPPAAPADAPAAPAPAIETSPAAITGAETIRMLVGQEGPELSRVRGQVLTIGTDLDADEAERLVDADFAERV